jgi:hypothetical protein
MIKHWIWGSIFRQAHLKRRNQDMFPASLNNGLAPAPAAASGLEACKTEELV